MSKKFYNHLTPALFDILLKGGNFKKIPSLKNSYINDKAEIIVVKRETDKIISYYNTNTKDSKITGINNSGYLLVGIEGKVHTIHSLVAEAFLGPRPKGYDIDHISGDKTDNRLCNLEYVTHKENIRRYYKNNTRKKPVCDKGKYFMKTQTYTAPTGEKVKMPFDIYLKFLEQTYGKLYANRIKRNHNR